MTARSAWCTDWQRDCGSAVAAAVTSLPLAMQPGEHYAVHSGAGTSGARKFEILREGLPEYGKTAGARLSS
jgi:hypothetical protein